MADTSYEFLTEFFRSHLSFTPTPRQVAEFQIDLSLASPYLIEAALVEVKRGRLGTYLTDKSDSWRPAIFKVYNRKVAEHAQLFCIFHSFETAFRSTVAVLLEKNYQHKRWWRKLYDEKKKGNPASTVRKIGSTHISRDAAHAIGEIIAAIDEDNPGTVEGLTNGYQFLECCSLTHIARLVDRHWFLFGPTFRTGTFQLSRADFHAKFNRIRMARNDVYHHKSVARTSGIIATAEELLDYLNFSLDFVFNKTIQARPAKPIFIIPIDPIRHHTWSEHRTSRPRRSERLTAFLIEERKKAGLTPVELAAKLKRDESYVMMIEGGHQGVDVIELLNFADAIGFDVQRAISELI